MGISAKLEMRQGQSLVMTPQLLQAIKLLQLSHLDLQSYVATELERNPLLERADDDPSLGVADPEAMRDGAEARIADAAAAAAPDDAWGSEALQTSREAIEDGLGTRLDNVFPDETPVPARLESAPEAALPMIGGATASSGGYDDDLPGFEQSLTVEETLQEALSRQLDLAVTDPVDRLIGRFLIDGIDEAGYLTEDIAETAERLGVPLSRVEAVLAVVHRFEPSGIGARSLAECLEIQLREHNRYDPAMAALIANLPLVAKRDHAALRRLCGVDEEDLAEMLRELRALDPKPGRAFAGGVAETVVPDVIVRAAPDGSWLIDLNPETLPRVLVNQTYHAQINGRARSDSEKAFIADCLQTANWLTRSLEQRARTILKVASEIVRQQDAFFAHGVEHLKPLNLKAVADAIGMHESTVSRVTSNKYLISPRGLFDMKYFFTAAIASTGSGEMHSAEAVRHKIKVLIEGEPPGEPLSDDTLVARLKEQGVDIARRTVAKYREALGIPSSMERRRGRR